jgi:hypothetical protein
LTPQLPFQKLLQKLTLLLVERFEDCRSWVIENVIGFRWLKSSSHAIVKIALQDPNMATH